MEFKRVFHPVGQGAFFTETFFNKEEGYGSTIVYDCGSISSKELLYREIDNFKNEHKSFNILFISHFDDDHINGLKRLLKKNIITNDDIDYLIKKYSIERSVVEKMIRLFLVEKHRDEIVHIESMHIESLIIEYSVEKYIIEDLIEKYIIERHIVEDEPIKKFLVEKYSNNTHLMHNALRTLLNDLKQRPLVINTLVEKFPIEDLLNESQIKKLRTFLNFKTKGNISESINRGTIDEVFVDYLSKYYDYTSLFYDYIAWIIDKYSTNTFIEMLFKENYCAWKDYLIKAIIDDDSNPIEMFLDKYQIKRIEKKYKIANIEERWRIPLISNDIEEDMYVKIIIDNLIDNGYVDNRQNNKVINKEYDIDYLVKKYIINEEGWDINGFIERYIENHPSQTVVVIPFLYPNLIRILLPEMKNELSEDTYDALHALFNSGIKIVGLDNDIYANPYQIENPSMNREDLYKDNSRIIKCFTTITERESEEGKVVWYYMPYNTIVEDGRKERFLIELVAALKESKDAIGDWFRNQDGNQIKEVNGYNQSECLMEIQNFLMDGVSAKLTNHEVIDRFVELLKQLYTKASPGIKGVTAINVNSLNVLSYSSDLLNSGINVYSNYTYENQKFEIQRSFNYHLIKKNEMHQWYQEYMRNLDSCYNYNEQMRFMHFSCLYTGDSVMENHFFDWIRLIRRQFLRSSIGLLQIPHHGRRKNYNKQVLSAPIFSSFINFKKGNKSNAFAKEIENDFCSKGIPCFEITQEEESRFVQTVIWNHQS